MLFHQHHISFTLFQNGNGNVYNICFVKTATGRNSNTVIMIQNGPIYVFQIGTTFKGWYQPPSLGSDFLLLSQSHYQGSVQKKTPFNRLLLVVKTYKKVFSPFPKLLVYQFIPYKTTTNLSSTQSPPPSAISFLEIKSVFPPIWQNQQL